MEPMLGAIMMEALQPIMTLQDRIVEVVSGDQEESLEGIVIRAKKGRWTRKNTYTLVDLP